MLRASGLASAGLATILAATSVGAAEPEKKEPEKKEPEKKEPEKKVDDDETPTPVSKPNAEVRAEEGKETALPSVAGRPVRRYAERNVLELGGSLTLVRSTSFTQFGAMPTFGWFFIDYVELSLLPSIEYVRTATSAAQARFSFLVEPSFHIFVTGPLFVFFGAGAGAVFEKDTGLGLAVAPRAGFNVLIGGSGVLSLGFAYVYTATRRTAIADGAETPHTTTLGIQAGYSVAW